MSETLNKNIESEPAEHIEGEYPQFQDRRVGLLVGEEEAKQIGEMPTTDRETAEKQAERWLADCQAEGSISSLGEVSLDQMIEANRGVFFDIQKRRAFIIAAYPELLDEHGIIRKNNSEKIPGSVLEELFIGESLCHHMLPPIDKSGIEDGVQYPNGAILPGFFKRGTAAAYFLRYQEARKHNDQIFDQEALTNFDAPTSRSTEEIEEKLEQTIEMIHATTDIRDLNLDKLCKENMISENGITLDIEAEYKWRELGVFRKIFRERSKQVDRIIESETHRIDEIDAQIKSLTARLRQLEAGNRFQRFRDSKDMAALREKLARLGVEYNKHVSFCDDQIREIAS